MRREYLVLFMACLIKRNNGIYYIISFKRGKRIWRSLCTSDRKEAEALIEEQQRLEKKGKGLTLREYWQEVKPIIAAECAKNTVDFYVYMVEMIIQLIGNKKLSAYTTFDFEKFKVRRLDHIRKVTVNKELRTIRALFQRAVKLGFLEKNQANGSGFLKVDEKRPTHLTPEQFYTLIEAIQDRNLQQIIVFAVLTAMRAGEIVFLEWSDVDFKERRIEVINKPEHRIKAGKERSVPMNDFIFSMLNEQRQAQGRVFLNTKGKPLTVKALSDRFRKYRIKAGLPEGIRFHSLRHTSLSWMHLNGVPLESLRQIAGHSAIQTTHLYTHVQPRHLLEAANTLNKYIPLERDSCTIETVHKEVLA